MIQCPFCGSPVEDGALFCTNCGNKLAARQQDTAYRRPASPARKIHCPECKSRNISPIVETTTEGGYAVNNSITRRTSVSNIKMNSTHRNYWMCSDCGSKFRNIQNLQAEIKSEHTKEMIFLGCMIAMLVCALIMLFQKELFQLFGPVVIILALITVCLWLVTKRKVSNMSQELAYLKHNCFN